MLEEKKEDQQEEETKPKTEPQEEEKETQTEGDTPEKEEEEAEEPAGEEQEEDPEDKKLVPSYRLREETQKRKALEDRLAELERKKEEGSVKSETAPARKTKEEIEQEFQADVEKMGWSQTIAKWTYGMAETIAERKVQPIMSMISEQQIDKNINSLSGSLKGIDKYSSEIKKELEKYDFNVRTNPEAVKRVYYQLLGEKAAKGELGKEIEKTVETRIKEKRTILGESGIPASKGSQKPSAGSITKEQETEMNATTMSKESYLKTLKELQEKDKKAGKSVRQTLFR